MGIQGPGLAGLFFSPLESSNSAQDLGMHVTRAGVALLSAVQMGVGLARGIAAAEGMSAPSTTASRQTLFHYTDERGLAGILKSGELRPSLKAVNPNDVRYGNGQYLSDIAPGTKTPAQLSREFVGQPFQGRRFTNYVEIDVTGLKAVQGRPGVFVVPNETPLDLLGRIVGHGVAK